MAAIELSPAMLHPGQDLRYLLDDPGVFNARYELFRVAFRNAFAFLKLFNTNTNTNTNTNANGGANSQRAKLTIVGADNTRASESNRRMPLHILRNVNEDMEVMQEEIFGPILPIMTYTDTTEVPNKIEPCRNPLALYYFGKDKGEQEYLLNHVTRGGACINDITLHCAPKDLPFDGVGGSGMGAYHGPEGYINRFLRTVRRGSKTTTIVHDQLRRLPSWARHRSASQNCKIPLYLYHPERK